jgi:hypothetical protein
MEKLIEKICETLKDYREDELQPDIQMTEKRINKWINQFEENFRIPILTEMDSIFNKRYCSKNSVISFLDELIINLAKNFNFITPKDFLQNSVFLDLQLDGKSQKIMLKLINEIILEKYEISLAQCGVISKKYSIYVDDILCTGLTFINDTKNWAEKKFSFDKTNKQAVEDNSTILVFAYVFVHKKNYNKKVTELIHKVSSDISKKHILFCLYEIENEIESNSKLDLILPLEENQDEIVSTYKNQIIERVNLHTEHNCYPISPEEFFRPVNLPKTESFFTNPTNRSILENNFLQKGIEILNKSNVTNKNIRALGYSIPASKNFGFGALCFTWRNVPNNVPLVFWYSGGGFFPLFIVKRTDSSKTFIRTNRRK